MDPKIHAQLKKYPNVTGSAVGYKLRHGKRTGEVGVIVFVDKKLPLNSLSPQERIPAKINGLPTDIRQMSFHIEDDSGTYRPAPPGCSIGHFRITAGTLGAVVRYLGKVGILSNNHVMANSNDASIGDRILQPGPYDDGKLPIASLTEFVEINFGGSPVPCPVGNSVASLLNFLAWLIRSRVRLRAVRAEGDNLVDAAFAEVFDGDESLLDPNILEIGRIDATPLKPTIGLKVQKRGRTTRRTTGEVTMIGATIQVGYDSTGTKVATFVDQAVVESDGGNSDFSAGGDSGSLVLTMSNKPTGLLFAGGTDESGKKVTIINDITNVLQAFPGMEFI